MKQIFAERAWDDYLYWQSHDKQMLKRINRLIQEVMRDPEEGIGKPELLRHEFAGYWSRRISDEHRMVYRAEEDALYIAQVRSHY